MPQCQQDTLCGVAMSPDLQQMLTTQPDLCSIVAECQVLCPASMCRLNVSRRRM